MPESDDMGFFIGGLFVGTIVGIMLFAVLTANDDDASRGHP